MCLKFYLKDKISMQAFCPLWYILTEQNLSAYYKHDACECQGFLFTKCFHSVTLSSNKRMEKDMFSKVLSEVKQALKLSDQKSNLRFWLLMGIFLEIFIEIIGRGSFFEALLFLVRKPAIFAFNTMIILAVLALAFLVRRRLLAFTLLSVLWLAIGITNGVLLIFRTTPFTAQDLLLVKYACGMAYDYLGIFGISLLIIGIIAVLAAMVCIFCKAPRFPEKISYLKTTGFIALLFFAILVFNEIATFAGLLPSNYGNIGEAYNEYGVAYCFANTLLNTGIKEPQDYDDTLTDDTVIKEAIKETDKETDSDTPADTDTSGASHPDTSQNDFSETVRKPNIIVIQLESFFDITEVKGLELTEDPIPFFHMLCEQYSSGYLSMPSVGAGTANSEFEMLTGMNIDSFGPGEYPYKTILQSTTCESAAYNLAELGYTSYAIHNNEGTFYDRHTVYPKLGFSCFIPIEYMYDLTYTETGWAEDKCLTTYITSIIEQETAPAFVYTVSVQGHGAYPHEPVMENPKIDILSMQDMEMYEPYRYYINQINEMDLFLKELVEALSASGEECVLVLFGDHLPGLELTEDMLEDGNMFLTKYAVWDNIGLAKQDRDLEAYQLMAAVCEQLDQHKGILCRYHQMYLEGTIDQTEYLEKLDALEYDMLYGDQLVYDGINPYKEQEMTLGLYPISISEITYKNGYLYVAGENFNEYSMVFVDDKQFETIYISAHLLVAQMDNTPDEIAVSVRQVGRDHVTLGMTPVRNYIYTKKPDVPNAGSYE